MASLREEQVRETRAALVAAGRARFGLDGFAATSVDDLAGTAGVTIGALYHHFRNKTELFAAVFEELHLEVLVRNGAAAASAARHGEVESLVAGFDDFLDAILDPVVCRIMITDGPAVLGLRRFTELDERFAFAAVVASLERANASGELNVDEPEALGHLLLGALVRGSMLIAGSESPGTTRNVVSRTIRDLLLGLRP